MSQNFQRGDLVGVNWIPQGQAGVVVLTVRDEDLGISALLHDVTTVLAGGGRARLGGLNDAASTVNAVYDADGSPYLATPNIVQGAGGLLLFGLTVGFTRSIQVPMRIETVHYKSGMETAVLYSFDAKMDVRVGLLVYPAL